MRNVLKKITSFAGDDFGVGVDRNCQIGLVGDIMAWAWAVIRCGCRGRVWACGVEAAEPWCGNWSGAWNRRVHQTLLWTQLSPWPHICRHRYDPTLFAVVDFNHTLIASLTSIKVFFQGTLFFLLPIFNCKVSGCYFFFY